MMTTLRKLLAFLGITFAVCVASSKESSGQTQTLTAFYTAHVVSMTPMWIAQETGLFKKHGADVRLVFIGSGPLGTTSILAGEVDIGIIGGFSPLRAFLGGAKNLVIIGQSKTYMVGSIVGKKEIASVQVRRARLDQNDFQIDPVLFTEPQFFVNPKRKLVAGGTAIAH
jgi:ABC-type nitrate/sulfonate/bicarbonate transport system substrate-binding protein